MRLFVLALVLSLASIAQSAEFGHRHIVKRHCDHSVAAEVATEVAVESSAGPGCVLAAIVGGAIGLPIGAWTAAKAKAAK